MVPQITGRTSLRVVLALREGDLIVATFVYRSSTHPSSTPWAPSPTLLTKAGVFIGVPDLGLQTVPLGHINQGGDPRNTLIRFGIQGQ